MSYEAITNVTSPNRTPGESVAAVFGTPRRIETITIHHWGNMGQRFEDVVNFLSTAANGRQSSAHYVVEAGRVACIVSPEDASWHAGNAYGNATSIGIECRPEATEGDYETVAELVAELREVYGDVPLVPHSDWTATACPGIWDLNRIDAMARGAVTTQGNYAAAPDQAGTEPAQAGDYDSGLVWIVDPGDTLAVIAKHYGVDADRLAKFNGIADPNRINVGDVLHIPGPLVWIVDPGDTLAGIASHYGMTVEAVQGLNGIDDPNRINVGQVLTIG